MVGGLNISVNLEVKLNMQVRFKLNMQATTTRIERVHNLKTNKRKKLMRKKEGRKVKQKADFEGRPILNI